MILLDTDVMIDILREYPPAINWLRNIEETDIMLPGFVVMELIQGCKSKIEKELLEEKLNIFEIIWPLQDSFQKALNVFSSYYLSHNLGIIDVLIGQTAIAAGIPLYTFNQKHYNIIPNIETVQPYKK